MDWVFIRVIERDRNTSGHRSSLSNQLRLRTGDLATNQKARERERQWPQGLPSLSPFPHAIGAVDALRL